MSDEDYKPAPLEGVDWTKLSLSAEEGFVLSRIDGSTSLKSLEHLTGLPAERVSHPVEEGAFYGDIFGDGVNIAAPPGTPVRAAENGVVTADHPEDPFRPQVKIVLDRLGDPLEAPALAVDHQDLVREIARHVDIRSVRRGLRPRRRARDGSLHVVAGRVVRGARLGRQLGFPTANLRFPRVPPLSGIFAARVHGLGDAPRPAVASFGTRPTVDGGEPLLEAHLFDFDGDLYGRCIEVEFVARLRDEERFDGLPALVAQMQQDAAQARAILDEEDK